jgi:hypothetical protein
MRHIVAINTQTYALTSKSIGMIKASTSLEQTTAAKEIQIERLGVDLCPNPSNSSAPTSTLEFLLDQCDQQITFAKKEARPFVFPFWYKLRRIIVALEDLGFLPEEEVFHFCHRDLFSRNILVELPDDETVVITGVVDWDPSFANFCPKFLALRAPFWMWHRHPDQADWTSNGSENDEMLAGVEPEKEEDKDMKKLFEELASEEWKRYAFTPEYMIARRLCYILMLRQWQSADIDEAENIIRAWQELHYEPELRDNAWYDDANGVWAEFEPEVPRTRDGEEVQD